MGGGRKTISDDSKRACFSWAHAYLARRESQISSSKFQTGPSCAFSAHADFLCLQLGFWDLFGHWNLEFGTSNDQQHSILLESLLSRQTNSLSQKN